MIRMAREQLQKLLVAMLYFQENGYTLQHVDRWVRDNIYTRFNAAYVPADQANKVKTGLAFMGDRNQGDRNQTMWSLIEQTIDQLGADTSKDRDLVDTIARAIQTSNARNSLSGQALDILRKALLVPDEVRELKRVLASERACSSCGHKFLNGEMSAFLQGADGGGSFCCIRCQRPMYISDDYDKERSHSVKDVKGLDKLLSQKVGTPPKDNPIDILNDIAGVGGGPFAGAVDRGLEQVLHRERMRGIRRAIIPEAAPAAYAQVIQIPADNPWHVFGADPAAPGADEAPAARPGRPAVGDGRF